MIFEIHAAENTAQLGFCGGYRLESSLSNTISNFAIPMRYSCISAITQNETPCKVLWDLGFSLTSETFGDVKMSRGMPQTSPYGWFSQIFVSTQVVGGGGLKSWFWPFSTFLAYRAQDCNHSRAPLKSSPARAVGSSGLFCPLLYFWFDPEVMVPEEECENTICNMLPDTIVYIVTNTCLS